MQRMLLAAVLVGMNTMAFAEDNCAEVKKSVTARFEIVRQGTCQSPSSDRANADGALRCADVLGDGGVASTLGHATVSNWIETSVGRVPLPDTYVGYCAGLADEGATDETHRAKRRESRREGRSDDGSGRRGIEQVRREIQRALESRSRPRERER